MKISRNVRVAGTTIVLLAAGWLIWSNLPGDGDQTAGATIGTLVFEVEVSGTLRAIESSEITPPVIEHVHRFKISMMAPEGESVTKGQPILAFDTSELQDRLRQHVNEIAEAGTKVKKEEVALTVQNADDSLAMAEAQARLRKARMASARPSNLFASIESDKARLDLKMAELEVERLSRRIAFSKAAAESKIQALQTDLERAQSEAERVKQAIESMVRKAPRDGVVTYSVNWRNEKKKVGDTCWRREPVLEIPDLTTMMGEGEVQEALSGRIAEGQNVTLHLDAHQDALYKGSVTQVVRAVQEKSWRNPEKIVRVDIGLHTTDPERMRPGMRFRGTIEVGRKSDILVIPIDAVSASPEGPSVRVVLWRGSKDVVLELGESDGKAIEVLSGLQAGDRIVYARNPA